MSPLRRAQAQELAERVQRWRGDGVARIHSLFHPWDSFFDPWVTRKEFLQVLDDAGVLGLVSISRERGCYVLHAAPTVVPAGEKLSLDEAA